MLKLIIRQANWGIVGSIFGFVIGFFVKTYVIQEVGTIEWGKYVTAHTFAILSDTVLSLGIPFIILKYFPDFMSKSKDHASQLIRRILVYASSISFVFLCSMYFLSPILDKYIYTNTDQLSYLLLIVSVHAPISIFMGVITSLYRSVFKIKEIILYGTFVSVPVRAVLTFIVFQFTKDIMFFVAIEIFTQLLTLSLLYYYFNKNEMNLFGIKTKKEFSIGSDVINYGKKIYAHSIVLFFSGQSLSFVLSIMLPPKQIGVYSILLTITALSLFLNKNLRKIFAPVISKLYAQGLFKELNILYKKTTFIVNLITIPFTILILFFADEILGIFSKTGDLLEYKPYLVVIMIARIISLLAGNSGTFMVMAGMEKKELVLQTVKAVFITILAVIFVKQYELIAIVTLFISFMLIVNIVQLFYIKKEINISPFSKDMFFLIILSVPCLIFAINQDYIFEMYHYILIPILIYILYFSLFYFQIKNIYQELK